MIIKWFRTFKVNPNTYLKPLYLEAYDKYNDLQNLLKPKFFEDFPMITRLSNNKIKEDNFSLPTIKESEIFLPIFNLENEFLNKGIYLENLIFNQPIRKDLIYRLHRFELLENKITTHIVKNQAEVAGSGKKPFKQKGMGRARQGNKRAAGRYHGGKAHGRRMRDLSIKLPSKVKLMAVKCLFSSKLSTGGIKIIDKEDLDSIKTKNLNLKLKNWSERESKLFILPEEHNKNFEIASNNLKGVKMIKIKDINVNDVLKFDKIIFTEKSLYEFTSYLLSKTVIQFKPKIFEPENINYKKIKETNKLNEVKYDPNKPFNLNFEILNDYYEQYKENNKNQNN